MAIKIPIVTVFDSKGLKQAQYQLNKVRGNFQNLGRNFAVAGAAIAGVATVIGKSVQNAAEAQRIFAQTEAVLKSTGTTANGTAREIANLASSLQKKTAVDDEAILAGQNLLLTFKGVQNQAGTGNDIFNQASQAMLDFARATNTDASSAAIKLGKALQDPTRGVTALRKSGVDFTKDQQEMIKSLVETGDLLGAQKIVLAELQTQFGGSAAAYAETFAGQIDSLKNEMSDLSEEIGLVVMPAVQEFFSALRDIAPEAGQKLKEALAGIDWSALAKALADLTIFFVENAETILKIVGAMWALNTAYNAGKVAVGLYNAAAVILGKTFTVTAGKIALSTGALKLFRTALITTGIGAFVVALGFIIEGLNEADSSYRNTTPTVTSWGKVVLKSGQNAEWAAGKYGIAAAAAWDLKNALDPKKEAGARNTELNNYLKFLGGRSAEAKGKEIDNSFAKILDEVGSGGSSTAKAAKKVGKIIGQAVATSAAQFLTQKNVAFTKSMAKKWISENAIKSDWQDAGSELGNNIVIGLQKAAEKGGKYGTRNLFRETLKTFTKLYEQVDVLQKKFIERSEFQTDLKESIMGAFTFDGIEKGIESIIQKFKTQVEQTKQFKNNLLELQKLGLSGSLFRKIVETKDFAAAAELVRGGTSAVSEMNSLYSQLEGFSNEISTVAGNQLYNLGVNAATGYIRTLEDGFGSLQKYANAIATKRNFLMEIQSIENQIRLGKVYGFAPGQEAGLRERLAKVESEARRGTLAQNGFEQNIRFGRIQTGLDQFLAQGGQLTESILAQVKFADLAKADQRELNRELKKDYGITINVSGGINTSAQIGQAIIEAIKKYETSSGQIFNYA